MPPAMKIRSIVLDCADPAPLAEFYGRLLDCEIDTSDPDWCDVYPSGQGGPKLSFQRTDAFVAPEWPDGAPQQVHLDFEVAELETTAAWALEVGASQLSGEVEDDSGSFIVFADPAGHPFCLVRPTGG